jgi:plastocyanin
LTLRRFIASFGAFLLLSALFSLTGTAVAAATTYEVTVGNGFGLGGTNCNHQTGAKCQAFGEDWRILPGTLKVAKGDVVHLFGGPVTLLPANTDVEAWVQDNATGIGEPYSPIAPDPDEGATGAKFNNTFVFPSDPTCGAATAPCTYDGSTVLNSGLNFEGPTDLSVTIDANPGDVVWALSLFGPGVHMRIQVVPAGQATDPSTIAAAVDAQYAKDLEVAESLHDKLWNHQSSHEVNGKRVWDAWAGFDTRYLSLDAMYPHVLNIHKGDKVRWHFDELVNNIHSVTTPFSKAEPLSESNPTPVCDPDGDQGPGPDTPPTSPNPPFCTDPTQLELDLDTHFTLPQGNHVLSSASDFESSGVRAGEDAAVTEPVNPPAPYDLTFAKTSPKAGFKYMCLIHGGGMQGTVHVNA